MTSDCVWHPFRFNLTLKHKDSVSPVTSEESGNKRRPTLKEQRPKEVEVSLNRSFILTETVCNQTHYVKWTRDVSVNSNTDGDTFTVLQLVYPNVAVLNKMKHLLTLKDQTGGFACFILLINFCMFYIISSIYLPAADAFSSFQKKQLETINNELYNQYSILKVNVRSSYWPT